MKVLKYEIPLFACQWVMVGSIVPHHSYDARTHARETPTCVNLRCTRNATFVLTIAYVCHHAAMRSINASLIDSCHSYFDLRWIYCFYREHGLLAVNAAFDHHERFMSSVNASVKRFFDWFIGQEDVNVTMKNALLYHLLIVDFRNYLVAVYQIALLSSVVKESFAYDRSTCRLFPCNPKLLG